MKSTCLTGFLFVLASYAGAQTSSHVNDEQLLKSLSNQWMQATMKRDLKLLDQLVAPEFQLGGSDLSMPGLPRAVWIKNTLENIKIDSVNYLSMRVRVVENVAVVQSKFFWSFSFQNQPARKDTVNLVDTWIKRRQGWQVMSRLVVE